MFVLYFLFSLVTSFLAFVLFVKRKIPLRDLFFVLFAPVTAPYFFFRINPGFSLRQKTVFAAIFYLCFLLVCTVETHLFFQENKRFTMANTSSLQRRMIQLSDKLKASTRALDLAIQDLDSLGKTVSSRTSIGQTISYIGTVRVMVIKNKNAVDQFIVFAREYKIPLQKEGFSDFLFVESFFTDPVVTLYMKSLEAYLTAFESLLNYTFDNFESIDSKSSPHLKNYDAYYIKYRRAVDRHNLLCARRIEFQKNLLVKHPGLELYLPGMIHTDFLKLWK